MMEKVEVLFNELNFAKFPFVISSMNAFYLSTFSEYSFEQHEESMSIEISTHPIFHED